MASKGKASSKKPDMPIKGGMGKGGHMMPGMPMKECKGGKKGK